MNKNASRQKVWNLFSEKRKRGLQLREKFTVKSLFSFLLIVFFIWLSYSVGCSLWNTAQHQIRIVQERNEKSDLQEEVENYEKQVEYYESDIFLEELGRNKLGLVSPEEKIVVLPEEKLREIENLARLEQGKKIEDNITIWKRWFFFVVD